MVGKYVLKKSETCFNEHFLIIPPGGGLCICTCIVGEKLKVIIEKKCGQGKSSAQKIEFGAIFFLVCVCV